jgi:D-ribose pyranose/furanose isomerase RbsD
VKPNPFPRLIPVPETGIPNPHRDSLLSRARHNHAPALAERSFPFWLEPEIVDFSLMDGIPATFQVVVAIRTNLIVVSVQHENDPP